MRQTKEELLKRLDDVVPNNAVVEYATLTILTIDDSNNVTGTLHYDTESDEISN